MESQEWCSNTRKFVTDKEARFQIRVLALATGNGRNAAAKNQGSTWRLQNCHSTNNNLGIVCKAR